MKIRLAAGDFEVSITLDGTPHPDLLEDATARVSRLYRQALQDNVDMFGLVSTEEEGVVEPEAPAEIVEEE